MSLNVAPKIISSLPPFVSPEEHKTLTSTTPESFSSIPPVLRLQEPNVSVSFDPPLQDFGPDDCKHGTLYIIERCAQSRLSPGYLPSHSFLVSSRSSRPQDAVSRSNILQLLSMPSPAQNLVRASIANSMRRLPETGPRTMTTSLR